MSIEQFDILEEKVTDLLIKYEMLKETKQLLEQELASKEKDILYFKEEVETLRGYKDKLDPLLKDNRINHLIENINYSIKEESDIAKSAPTQSQPQQQSQPQPSQTQQQSQPQQQNNETKVEIKPSTENDVVSISEDDDPFSSADDSSWDNEIENNANQKEEPAQVEKAQDDYEDEYLFDDDDEFDFEESK